MSIETRLTIPMTIWASLFPEVFTLAAKSEVFLLMQAFHPAAEHPADLLQAFLQ
jgi:hypothetical protein